MKTCPKFWKIEFHSTVGQLAWTARLLSVICGSTGTEVQHVLTNCHTEPKNSCSTGKMISKILWAPLKILSMLAVKNCRQIKLIRIYLSKEQFMNQAALSTRAPSASGQPIITGRKRKSPPGTAWWVTAWHLPYVNRLWWCICIAGQSLLSWQLVIG